MGQPAYSEENLATLKSFHPANPMAGSSAYRSSHQNPHDGKDKLVGQTPTKGSNRYTSVSATTYASTPVVASIIAPLIVSGSANSSVIRYSKNDL